MPRLAHRPALDGLRGAAVLSVLLYHTGVLRGGWIGVDTFFVLSGYLITSLLLAEHDRTGGIALKAFWGRRARRLLPALFLLLAGVGLFAALVATAEARSVIRQDLWGALTYGSNWLDIVRGSGYWQTFTQPSPLAHIWSLAIEEQFYVVWPLVAWWALRRGGARTAGDGGGRRRGSCSPPGRIGLAWAGASVDRLYLGTDTRAPALLLGATLGALRVGTARPGLLRVAHVAGPLGVALLVWAAFTLDGRDPEVYRGALLGVSLAGALAVVGASQDDGGWFGRVVGWRPLCVLGILSYGIYLAHWPILLAVQHWSHLGPWATTAVVAPLTIAVAAASYLVVEHPIRLRRGLAWSRPALLPVLAAGCVLAAVGGTVGARPGLQSVDERTLLAALPAAARRPSTSTAATGPSDARGAGRVRHAPADDHAPPDDGSRDDPRPAIAPATVPATALAATVSAAPSAPLVAPMARPAGRTPRVLAVGDSVAYSLSSALTTMGRRSAIDVAVRAAPGCTADDQRTAYRDGPTTKKEPSVCPTMVQRWPRDVERFQPDLVLLLYGGFVQGWLVDGQPLDACDPAYRAHYERAPRPCHRHPDRRWGTARRGPARLQPCLRRRGGGRRHRGLPHLDLHGRRRPPRRPGQPSCASTCSPARPRTPATRRRSTADGCASTASTTGTRRPAWPASGSSTSWSSPRRDPSGAVRPSGGGRSGVRQRCAVGTSPGHEGPSG